MATRIQVTRTPAMAQALAAARAAWPAETHASRLIERLAVIGAEHLTEAQSPEQRRARIKAALTPAATRFGDNYLDTVRAGWK